MDNDYTDFIKEARSAMFTDDQIDFLDSWMNHIALKVAVSAIEAEKSNASTTEGSAQ